MKTKSLNNLKNLKTAKSHAHSIFSAFWSSCISPSLLDITNSPALTSLGLVITNSPETPIMSFSSLLDNITNLPICQFGSHDSSPFCWCTPRHISMHFPILPQCPSTKRRKHNLLNLFIFPQKVFANLDMFFCVFHA